MMAAQQERQAGETLGLIGAGLFQGLVSSYVTVGSSSVSESVESHSNSGGQQQLHIPPQVLVPLSMKSPASSSVSIGFGGGGGGDGGGGDSQEKKSCGFVVPEGRVHGGSLLSLLGGSFKNALDAGLV